MKRSKLWWLGVALLCVVVVYFVATQEKSSAGKTKAAAETIVRKRSSQPDFEKERETSEAVSRKRILADWADLLNWLQSEPAPSQEEIQERLLATRVAWAAMDSQVLAEMLQGLLASGVDQPTGLDFVVGPHGFLRSWPTLRVFLLDVLAASDPEMGAEIARSVLAQTASADEYAVALRSLTRKGMGRADDGELVSRFGQLLAHEDWQNSPGFAEAMDLPRIVGTPEAARRLASWRGNPALKSMALHEYAAQRPGEVLQILETSADLDPIARAGLMARANPADPKQLAAVDGYLRSSGLSAGEASEFLKAFPLRSATTGYRLYGETPAPYTFEKIVAGDRAALERVNQWVNDPALGNYRRDLLSLQDRLSKWNEQTK